MGGVKRHAQKEAISNSDYALGLARENRKHMKDSRLTNRDKPYKRYIICGYAVVEATIGDHDMNVLQG